MSPPSRRDPVSPSRRCQQLPAGTLTPQPDRFARAPGLRLGPGDFTVVVTDDYLRPELAGGMPVH